MQDQHNELKNKRQGANITTKRGKVEMHGAQLKQNTKSKNNLKNCEKQHSLSHPCSSLCNMKHHNEEHQHNHDSHNKQLT